MIKLLFETPMVLFRYFQVLLYTCGLASILHAQSNVAFNENTSSVKFKNISVEDGLSQSTVFCILQDREGFMWFGTRGGGLNKYDGYDFTVFKNDPSDSTSLSNNEVISLFEDADGQLWVGTRKGGLNKFDKATETFQQFVHSDNRGSIAGNTVNAIFQDSQKRLWFGTSSGIELFAEGVFLHNQIPNIGNKNITSIDEDSEGNLYISDKTGLYIWNRSSNLTKYYQNNDVASDAVRSNYSVPVVVDKDNRVWLGSSNGLKVLNEENEIESFESFYNISFGPKSETREIHEDADGNIWVGTIQGLYKFDYNRKTLDFFKKDENSNESLGHNSIYSIYQDRSGSVWVGTWGGGVSMLSDKLWKFDHYKHFGYNDKSLSNNVVSSFEEDYRGLWIGTEVGGLNFKPKNKSDFIIYRANERNSKALSSDHVKTLFHDSRGRLWVGTFGKGLNLFNKNTGAFQHFLDDEKIFTLAEGPNGNLWVGTLNGLYRFNYDKNQIKYFTNIPNDETSLSHSFVDVLYLARNNVLWVGTKEAGLMRYNPSTENFERFKNIPNDSTSLSSNYIISLSEDSEGKLLIGTNNGLNIYNPAQNNFINVKIEGLPDLNINGVLSDDSNNYWISTNKGISKYSPLEGIINYDLKDGLQSNEFNRSSYFKGNGGKFYFGGINGFNVFHPDSILMNTNIPPIVITDFKISNMSARAGAENSPLTKAISETEEIVLDYNESDFSFDFVALNYISPEKNKYAYRLLGYNNKWIYSGTNRTATYTNIPSGEYVFEVKGANNDNKWNETGVSIKIRIKPPIWKTPLAYIIYTITLLLLLALFRRITAKGIEQKNIIKNERQEKERIEELNQLKLRFFTNISHEFRTPLTLISGPLSKISTYQTDNEEQKYLLRIVQNNVKRLLLLVNELMDFRKAENEKYNLRVSNTNLVGFLEHIIDCFSENALENSIVISFNNSIDANEEIWFDQGILDKVIFNLLSNAIKHTPKDKAISVSLEKQGAEALITIKDSGIGIAQEDLEKIFDRFYQIEKDGQASSYGTGIGLAFVKRLIQVHRGRISVESEVGKGTSFLISIPIEKEAYSENELVDSKKHDVLKATQHPVVLSTPTVPLENEGKGRSKLLIVEDNDELRGFLTSHFNQYKLLVAANGKEGLELAKKEIPDIIISDIMMPEMDGLEMCTKLRSYFATSHIPIVLLTAKSEMSQKIEGLDMGADAYIEKPFDIGFLDATISSILKQRRAIRQKFSNEPDIDLDSLALNVHETKFVEKVNSYITQNISNPDLSVEMLALELGLSRSQLFRKIRSVFETTPSEIIRIERLKYSKKVLLELNFNINEVADHVGFKSTPYFITSFKKYYGITPKEYLTRELNKIKKQ